MSVTALALILLASPPAEPPDPQVLLKATLAAYQAARTFSETSTEVQTIEGAKPLSRTYTHQFFFEAPNRFFYDVREQGQLVAVAVSDGKTLRVDNRLAGKKLEMPAPASLAAMDRPLTEAGMATRGDPFAFIVLGAGKPDEPHAPGATLRDDTLDGRAVYRIDVPDGEQAGLTLWIGKQDRLIYRFEQFARQVGPDGPQSVRAVETHADIKVDQKLPADAFVAPQEP